MFYILCGYHLKLLIIFRTSQTRSQLLRQPRQRLRFRFRLRFGLRLRFYGLRIRQVCKKFNKKYPIKSYLVIFKTIQINQRTKDNRQFSSTTASTRSISQCCPSILSKTKENKTNFIYKTLFFKITIFP